MTDIPMLSTECGPAIVTVPKFVVLVKRCVHEGPQNLSYFGIL